MKKFVAIALAISLLLCGNALATLVLELPTLKEEIPDFGALTGLEPADKSEDEAGLPTWIYENVSAEQYISYGTLLGEKGYTLTSSVQEGNAMLSVVDSQDYQLLLRFDLPTGTFRIICTQDKSQGEAMDEQAAEKDDSEGEEERALVEAETSRVGSILCDIMGEINLGMYANSGRGSDVTEVEVEHNLICAFLRDTDLENERIINGMRAYGFSCTEIEASDDGFSAVFDDGTVAVYMAGEEQSVNFNVYTRAARNAFLDALNVSAKSGTLEPTDAKRAPDMGLISLYSAIMLLQPTFFISADASISSSMEYNVYSFQGVTAERLENAIEKLTSEAERAYGWCDTNDLAWMNGNALLSIDLPEETDIDRLPVIVVFRGARDFVQTMVSEGVLEEMFLPTEESAPQTKGPTEGSGIQMKCMVCSGTGSMTCLTCAGRGYNSRWVQEPDPQGGLMWVEKQDTCFECGGMGSTLCIGCAGTGYIQ